MTPNLSPACTVCRGDDDLLISVLIIALTPVCVLMILPCRSVEPSETIVEV
jgi:hypothetical protein